MSTKIHLFAAGQPRFLNYGCICVESLLRLGGVKPADILFSSHEIHAEDESVQVLNGLGVSPRLYKHGEVFASKVLFVDRAFREDADLKVLLQLDTDVALTEKVDFLSLLPELLGEAHVATYQQEAGDPLKTYDMKAPLFQPGWKMNNPLEAQRLDAFYGAAFGVTNDEFRAYLGAEGRKWIHGGFSIYSRDIMDTLFWKALVAFSWLSVCDETAIMLTRFAAEKKLGGFEAMPEFVWGKIEQQTFPHRVNPPVLTLSEGPGMEHFAGDWYREKDEGNREKLAAAYRRVRDMVL
jgi:hypothetical protein